MRVLARLRRLGDLASDQSKGHEQVLYLVSITTIILFMSAVGFYGVEAEANPDIDTLFDAIWWASVTSTAVGYGDITPMTTEGRLIAMALMFYGVALIGTLAGFVTSAVTQRATTYDKPTEQN